MILDRLSKFKYSAIFSLVVGLCTGFALAPDILHARVSLSNLQSEIAELQNEDVAASGQLVIQSVTVETTSTETILDIYGVNFDASPTVTIDGLAATVAAGSTSTHIEASVPTELVPGTYLVTVSTGSTRSEYDAADVAVGLESSGGALTCIEKTATSSHGPYGRTAVAYLPSGYTRTGGGCWSSNAHRKLTNSYPYSGNGWLCSSQDHQYVAYGQVRAYVIGCKVE